jgi:hypothetical protein
MSGHPELLALIVLLILLPVLFPKRIRKMTLALLGKAGREAVGRRALAAQPGAITLIPAVRPPSAPVRALLEAFGQAGFEPAGDFLVKEMRGLPVRFMVRPADSITAAVYEQPIAGVWYNFYTHYADGTGFTFSSGRLGRGLDPRPGHPVEWRPGLAPAAMLAAFLTMRPAGAMKAVTAAGAAAEFCRDYAESIAWRKRRGLRAEEVEKAGMETLR